MALMTKVVVPSEALSRLQPYERDYIHGHLKRKERNEIARLLDDKRVRSTEVPLRVQVLRSCLKEALKLQIFDELRSGQGDKYVHWVRRVLKLPLGRVSGTLRPAGTQVIDVVQNARETLNTAVTGHALAKREVLKLVCQEAVAGVNTSGAYSLGFEGPPGTGKTHFVRNALAPALGRPFVSIPLGGATDISYLLGSVYTYEGSKEGRLASALIEAGCCNPIVYFDEVDKISQTERGREIVNTLIHLVDPTANAQLRDRYFHGVDLDFSRCTFVFSYNDPLRVSPILLDRIKRVAMPPPSHEERIAIIREHLEPRAQERLHTTLTLSEEAIVSLLVVSGRGGMRQAERAVDHILAAAQLCVACDDSNDGALAGHPSVAVLNEDSAITAAFASAALAELGSDSDDVPPPPPGMYN